MSSPNSYLASILNNLRQLRENAAISQAELEERLVLGPGWIETFESGKAGINLEVLLAIVHEVGGNLSDLFEGLPAVPIKHTFDRYLTADALGEDVVVNFKYSSYDAVYRLENANIEEFNEVVKELRDGLSRLVNTDAAVSEAIKTEAVARSFFRAVELWPNANPSDIWWFIIYRAYCDPYNHPAGFARLDFTQSWKRTSGLALEEILVRHYAPYLKKHNVKLYIATASEKQSIVEDMELDERIEADKIDVVISGNSSRGEDFFGVVHVKASFAERRTDDVPMSAALVRGGYVSPLWTMDCKSRPSKNPVNSGELGRVSPSAQDRRSAKRKDIEDEGYFSGCFSYNRNTVPTPPNQNSQYRIHVCDFSNPADAFSNYVIAEWNRRRPA